MNSVFEEDIERILSESVNWEKLCGKSVLVTGASGMIGNYVISVLIGLNRTKNMNLSVYGLLRHPEKLSDEVKKQIVIIEQSVTEPISDDYQFDYIVHTASPASPLILRRDPVGTIAANVLGVWNTLQSAYHSKADGYLFISSREVYGQPTAGQDVFDEKTYGFVDPLDPRSCYPEGKKVAETMCVCYHQQYSINTKVARLAHTYGPGMSVDDGRVQADFFRDVINHRNIVLKSEGASVRTYTYVSDAVAALFYILLNGDDEEIAYNISSEDSVVSIRQLAETMVRVFPDRHLSIAFDIPKKQSNDGTAPFTAGILSSDKLKALGWKPKISLEEGIKRTIKYLEDNTTDCCAKE